MSGARVIRQAEATETSLRGDRGVMREYVNAAIGSRDVDLHVNRLLAGLGPGPYHRHDRVENVYLVLEGHVRVVLDGVEHLLDPGDAAFIPRGVPHSASNVGEGDALLVEVYAPAEVDFIEEPNNETGR